MRSHPELIVIAMALSGCTVEPPEEQPAASRIRATGSPACTAPWDHRSCFYQQLLTDPTCRNSTIMWGPNDNETGATNTAIANWDIPTYDCVRRIAKAFATEYPDRVKAVDVGKTVDGKLIQAIRIGTTDHFQNPHPRAGQPKPVVLFDASTHGNEREGTRIVLDWMDHILNPQNEFDGAVPRLGYPGAPAGHTLSTLRDERIVWVVPAVNADNLNVNNGRPNRNSVNLARNYLWGWSAGDDPTYPFSQPETVAMARLAEMIQPSVYLNVHGWRHGLKALADGDGDDKPDGYNDPAGQPLPQEIQTVIGGISYLHATAGGRLIPIGSTSVNWSVIRSDPNDPNSFPRRDAIQYVCRGVPGLCPTDDSLPALADMNQDTNTAAGTPDYQVTRHMGPRRYSPFSPNDDYAHYDAADWDALGGGAGGSGQSFGHMNVGLGALSILYEIPFADSDSDLYGTGSISVPTPIVFSRGSKPTASFIWGIHKQEESVQMLIRDSFYPMNKLALAASNPIPRPLDPASSPAVHNDLSLSAVRMTKTGCSMDYSATYESTPSSILTARNGYYGTRDVACTATNLGEKTSKRFRIEMSISENGTAAGGKICISPETGLAVERSQTCTLGGFTFKKDQEYAITCRVAPRAGDIMETERALVTESNHAGCAALYAVSGYTTPAALTAVRPECVWNVANGHWDAVYQTNNRRVIRFKAALDQAAVCNYQPWDDRIDVNGNIPNNGSSSFGIDFAVPGNWSASAAAVAPSNIDGKNALAVVANGFSFINSRAFNTSELGNVTGTITVDARLPNPLPNPYWKGDLQLAVTCANDGLYNVWIGQASFASLTPGSFQPVSFHFDSSAAHSQVLNVFRQDGHTCSVAFSLTVPTGAATYYLGDIRFE
jgi:hypothetical protein